MYKNELLKTYLQLDLIKKKTICKHNFSNNFYFGYAIAKRKTKLLSSMMFL